MREARELSGVTFRGDLKAEWEGPALEKWWSAGDLWAERGLREGGPRGAKERGRF